MTNQNLILNIAVNLGRLGRWSLENKISRIPQFLEDTQQYIDQLTSLNAKFYPTYDRFLENFSLLKSTPPESKNWSDTAFTWAAILTHRAKLA